MGGRGACIAMSSACIVSQWGEAFEGLPQDKKLQVVCQVGQTLLQDTRAAGFGGGGGKLSVLKLGNRKEVVQKTLTETGLHVC
jgi:hypothetical protein